MRRDLLKVIQQSWENGGFPYHMTAYAVVPWLSHECPASQSLRGSLSPLGPPALELRSPPVWLLELSFQTIS